MNTHEQRVREFAYQIWESEGRPVGHEYRHWEMANKLAEGPVNDDVEPLGSGHVLSVIAPEEPFNPEPAPEIDPAPPQPGQPTPPAHPNIPPRPTPPQSPSAPQSPNVPVEPIAPVETPPHISPTPPAQPIHPSDPVQPGSPQPIQPYASKRASTSAKR